MIDQMQQAGLGVPDSQIASDFARPEERSPGAPIDKVNWAFTLLIAAVAVAVAAVFWPGRA